MSQSWQKKPGRTLCLTLTATRGKKIRFPGVANIAVLKFGTQLVFLVAMFLAEFKIVWYFFWHSSQRNLRDFGAVHGLYSQLVGHVFFFAELFFLVYCHVLNSLTISNKMSPSHYLQRLVLLLAVELLKRKLHACWKS